MRSIKALAPARIRWAIELLELEPRHSVLEIGCGSGVAAQHICARLGRGRYHGVDSSPAAIKAALARNAANAAHGRALFDAACFAAEALDPAKFDRVLAVNVNAFWTGEGVETADALRMLNAKGRLTLVFEAQSARQRAKIAAALKQRFAPLPSDFSLQRRTLGGASLLALVAQAPPRRRQAKQVP